MFSHVINETKRLRQVMRSCLFQHVRRDGNILAHCLVKKKKAVLSANLEV